MEPADRVYTVTEITEAIKRLLESRYDSVLVEGELSSVTIHTSGHCYFTLKDAEAQLRGVMWRSRVARLGFRPETGMQVRMSGRISVYEPRGQYQLIADFMQPAGEGALQQAFERLKRQLAQEGLFDPEHKKELPTFPKAIGIVTSRDGAALRDILSVLSRRFPLVQVVLVPTAVQGTGAATRIAEAIALLNRQSGDALPFLDLLIVGRGGGSIEDLWAFNEEPVARAIYASAIPVVSAVGHETDFTICDFVADVRAATPSIAAELTVPDREALLVRLNRMETGIRQRMQRILNDKRRTIQSLLQSHSFRKPLIRLERTIQQFDEAGMRLDAAAGRILDNKRRQIELLENRLHLLNPSLPMERGYAIVESDGRRIKQAAALHPEQEITLQFSDGHRKATVDG